MGHISLIHWCPAKLAFKKYLNDYGSEKYHCNSGLQWKVRLLEQKISDLHHDGHRFRNVILKGIKSLIILS